MDQKPVVWWYYTWFPSYWFTNTVDFKIVFYFTQKGSLIIYLSLINWMLGSFTFLVIHFFQTVVFKHIFCIMNDIKIYYFPTNWSFIVHIGRVLGSQSWIECLYRMDVYLYDLSVLEDIEKNNKYKFHRNWKYI